MVDGYQIQVPKICPSCSTNLSKEGEYLQCPNIDCPARILGNFEKWVEVTEIDECGPAFLEDIIRNELVDDIGDLYRLIVDDLIALPGYKKRRASKIVSNIQKKRVLPLDTFLAGLNIPNVGRTTFKKLREAGHDSLEKIQKLDREAMVAIDGIGSVTADLVIAGLVSNKDRIEGLLEAGVTIEQPKTGKLAGMSFCFTGSLSIRRSAAQKLVKDLGGEAKSSVSKGLTYLVQSDPKSESGKAQKARKYGTKVISEDDFLEMVDFTIDKLL